MGLPSICVERLEDRRLLSATPHSAISAQVKKIVPPIPTVTGNYIGTVFFAAGTTDGIRITVTKQHRMLFSGSTIQDSGPAGRLTGSVTRRGIVHALIRGTNIRFTSTINGAYLSGLLDLSFRTVQQRLHLRGSIDLENTNLIAQD